MGCGTNIVPGFKEFDTQYQKDVKDPALEMKISSELSKEANAKNFMKGLKVKDVAVRKWNRDKHNYNQEGMKLAIVIESVETHPSGSGPAGYVELYQDGSTYSDWSVGDINLDARYHNQGIGKRLYLKSIEEVLKKDGSYLSSGGMTSHMAARVWQSLYNMNPREQSDMLLKMGFPQLIGAFKMTMPAQEEFNIDSRGDDSVSIDEYVVEHFGKDKEVESYEQMQSYAVWEAELRPGQYKENIEKLSGRGS